MTSRNGTILCPYVGLRPFDEEHRKFFFGRESDLRVIVANISTAPLTILYGSSGVGKSSVLMAGVVPQLKASKHNAVIVFRNWQHDGFADELKQACIDAVGLSSHADVGIWLALPFDDLLSQLGEKTGARLLLIFDQFEEYFFYHPAGPTGEIFESEFARAVNRDEVNANFLIALREDGLAKLDRFRIRIPNLLGNSLRLKHMDNEAAERAITKPLEVYNDRFSTHFSIEDDLVKEILEQIRVGTLALSLPSDGGKFETREPSKQEANQQIEAPFLQLVMERLWEEEIETSSVLRLGTFKKLGGATKIARTHLERKLDNLTQEEKWACAGFFDRLVTPSGAKVACRLDDLTQWTGKHVERLPSILKQLEDGRILRRIESSAGSRDAPPLYEVFHDVLAGAILAWRKQYLHEWEIAEVTREAEEKQRQAEEKAKRAEQDQVDQRNRAEKETRNAQKFKILSSVLSVLLVLLVVLAAMFWKAEKIAQDKTIIASVREHIANAVNNLDANPELSVILGREALLSARGTRSEDVANKAADVLSHALAASPLRLNFLASDSPMIALTYGAQHNLLATVSEDGTAILWDAKSGRRLHTLPGSTGILHKVGFSPTEELVAAFDHKAGYVWNVDSGHLLHPFPSDTTVTDVAFSPDWRRVATGTDDDKGNGTVQVWDIASGKPLQKFTFGISAVKKIAFSPLGRIIATTHQYGDVMLLNPETGKRQKLVDKGKRAHDTNVSWVAFSRDGKRLATASFDKTAKLWDVDTGKLKHTLKGHSDLLNVLEFSPDGKQLVTTSNDNDARVWNTETGKLVHKLSGHNGSVFGAIFSPSGKLIATASDDGSIRLWNTETGEFMFRLNGHSGPVQDVAFSADEKTVFSSSWDGTAKAWTIAGKHVGPVNEILFSKIGQLATASQDGTVNLWDPAIGEVLHTLSGHRGPVQTISFSPDGKGLATAGVDKTVKLWDTATGKEIATLLGHTDTVYDSAYNPQDSKLLATASFDGRVLLWTLGSGSKKPVELGSHEWQVLSLVFSPDGARLASAGINGDAFIWDVKSKKKYCEFTDPKVTKNQAQNKQINKIRFGPKGDYVVTASEDYTAKIWGAKDCSLIAVLNHTDTVSDAAFNPSDGKTVVTASYDKTVKVWEVPSGKLLDTLVGHAAPVVNVEFDREGSRIATASKDGTTKIWAKNRSNDPGMESFKEILTLMSGDQVNAVNFSPDGSRVAIGNSTGGVIIFPFDDEELITLAKKRITRELRPDECNTYLHLDACPSGREKMFH